MGGFYKSDRNQAKIAADLRADGHTVQLIEGANGQRGVPDMVVGVDGVFNLLFEVKDVGGVLSPQQREWHLKWGGTTAVIRSTEDARLEIETERNRRNGKQQVTSEHETANDADAAAAGNDRGRNRRGKRQATGPDDSSR